MSPYGQHQNQIDYIFCSQRWRNSIQSAKTKPGSDGSDHQLLIAKFRLKLKKVGETSRPFRYDPNQIPYDYTVKVMNRFKGSDLVETECPKNYGGRLVTLCRRQWPKSFQRKRNARRQSGCLRGGFTKSWGKKRISWYIFHIHIPMPDWILKRVSERSSLINKWLIICCSLSELKYYSKITLLWPSLAIKQFLSSAF